MLKANCPRAISLDARRTAILSLAQQSGQSEIQDLNAFRSSSMAGKAMPPTMARLQRPLVLTCLGWRIWFEMQRRAWRHDSSAMHGLTGVFVRKSRLHASNRRLRMSRALIQACKSKVNRATLKHSSSHGSAPLLLWSSCRSLFRTCISRIARSRPALNMVVGWHFCLALPIQD